MNDKTKEPKINDTSEDLLTVSELAVKLKLSELTIYRWVQDNKIKYYRIGKHLRFKLSEVLDDSRQGG
jgi:excisionase family DNA binding protein